MRQLIEKAKNGDRHSIRQLLIVHRTLIESVVRRFLWNKGEIEDVLQDVFIKVVKSIATFDGKCRIDTWLYRLAVNECIDTNRRNHRLAKRFESSEMGMDIFPDLNASDGLAFTISEESSALVVSIIHTLPDAMRAACELYYLNQESGEEAAAKLHISVPAFFVRLRAAREQLKKKLVKKGDDIW